jgi:hypothetical protein
MSQVLPDNSTSTYNPIIPAPTAIETFRDAGYKSTASALSELIDNSIEAKAKHIQILTFEAPVVGPKRTVHRIDTIAVYDDGHGMSPDTLKLTLQFGMGTRLNTRSGIGRFGIGLPNASVSQCKHVEVYSWQNEKCYKTYLDIDEIKENNQQFANPVVECEMPDEYLKHIEGELNTKSGSLIVWKKCDRLDIHRSTVLYKAMERDLCRVYRHFLDNDNSYGHKVDIKLIVTGKDRTILKLRANDPMYLLVPNNTPEHEVQATNVAYGNTISIPVPYDDEGNVSIVEMRFSIALPEVQAMGGNSALGKHYQLNTGISIVRACREIDFGDFNFFNPREERQRWWGCEIRFDPVLDDLFGVTNNKQSVRGIKFLDMREFKLDHGEHWADELKRDRKLNMLSEISRNFEGNHSNIMNTVTNRHKGKQTIDSPTIDKATKVANELLEKSKEETKSHLAAVGKTEDEKRQEWLKSLEKNGAGNLSTEELENLVEQKAKLKIDFDFGAWPGEQFFTIETRGETLVVVINKRHPFYTELYEPLSKDNDSRFVDAMELIMMAYARTEDELYSYTDELQEIRSKWGNYVQKFLKALKEEA